VAIPIDRWRAQCGPNSLHHPFSGEGRTVSNSNDVVNFVSPFPVPAITSLTRAYESLRDRSVICYLLFADGILLA